MFYSYRSNLQYINNLFSLFIISCLIFSSAPTFSQTNEFHPVPILQGSTNVKLQPIESVQLDSSEMISFGMPFPKGYLTDLSSLRVFNDEGDELPIFVKTISPWRDISTASDESSLRSVLIQLEVTFHDKNDDGEADLQNLTVEWGGSTRILDDLAEHNTRSNWRLVDSELYSRDELVFEPPVYAVFSAEWYGLSVIKTRLLPKDTHPDFSVYEDFSIQFSNTALSKVDPRVSPEYLTDYKTAYASWLFDRAMTLYQIAFKSGDYTLLRESHRASQFFANHIDSNGYFDLKSYNDLKYSHVEGLASNYWLTGDDNLKDKISSMVNAFDSFNMNYSLDTNFWTERHAAAVLSGYVVAFEVLGEPALAHKATNAFSTLYKMQNEPVIGINATGGLMHTMVSHGEGGTGLMSSPWMSALLIDAVERYYIHSSDIKVKDFTYKLADYLAEEGLYSTDVFFNDTLPVLNVPYYIAGANLTDNEKYFNPWADVEHSLDVSKIFALAHFFDKQELSSSDNYLILFSDLFKTSMEYNLPNWIRPSSSSLKLGEFQGGQPIFRLSPPRKFNWWFRTTANLDWLIGLDTRFTASNDLNANDFKNPIIDMELTSSTDDVVENEIITFSLSYENRGNDHAIDTILVNEFLTNSDYYEVISISDNGVYANNNIYWKLGVINSGEGVKSVTFSVKALKPEVKFTKERPSPPIISLTSARYGSFSNGIDSIEPSTNVWSLGKYTHLRMSNTSVVTTSSFIEKSDLIVFNKTLALNEDSSTSIVFDTTASMSNIKQYKVIKQPLHGVLSGEFPELIYTPDLNFYGTDYIELVFNEAPILETGIISFNVSAINDAPTVNDMFVETNKNIPVDIVFEAFDIDSDTFIFSIVQPASNGVVLGNGSTVTYQPNHDFIGQDQFIYNVFDGQNYREAVVIINIDKELEIGVFIEKSIIEDQLAGWIGNYILNRLDLFEGQLIIVNELTDVSELELLKAKNKANALLRKVHSYLVYASEGPTKDMINSQIKDLLISTVSSDLEKVIAFSEYIYNQLINNTANTYFLEESNKYLMLFDYYLSKSEFSEATIVLQKAEDFSLVYIEQNPENLVYSEVYDNFSEKLKKLLPRDEVIEDEIIDEVTLESYVTRALEKGNIANWIGDYIIKKVALFDNQVLIVDELSQNLLTTDLELLKAKNSANMKLMNSHVYLNYTPDGEVLNNITDLIKESLFNTLSSDRPEVVDFSDFLYIQIRDTTAHTYFLGVTKEHLIYIDYYIVNNDFESANAMLVEAQRTLNYYMDKDPENEVYKEISSYYEESIKPLIN